MESASLQHWLWLLPLGLAALWVGSPRFLGTQASHRLGNLLKAGLDGRNVTLLQHLDLSVGGRVMHFDYLVLGRTGIFVIDALYLPGRVKGQRAQAWWQRIHLGRTHRFANPVHENYLRLQALHQALHLAPSCFHPCVGVSGQDSIDTDAKDVVIDVQKVAGKINGQTRPLLSAEELNLALHSVQQLQVDVRLLGGRARRWQWLRVMLFAMFLAGLAWVYQGELQHMYRTAIQIGQPGSQPADAATQLQRWEDSLICSYSVDTQRCACYTPRGEKAKVTPERCQQLAERGSVLEQ